MPSSEHIGVFNAPVDTTGGLSSGSIEAEPSPSLLPLYLQDSPEKTTQLLEELHTQGILPNLDRWPRTGGYPPPLAGGSPKQRIDLPIETLVQLSTEGLSSEEIAEKFGVSSATIRDRLHEAGVELEWGGYRWSGQGREGIGGPRKEIPLDEIRWLYEERDRTSDEIAQFYDCSYATILRRLEDAGVEIRRPGR